MRASFITSAVLAAFWGLTAQTACSGGSTKVYTISDVTHNIQKSLRLTKHHRRKGELAKASDLVLAESDRVLKVYSRSTLTYKYVKELSMMVVYIGNLCLDHSQELLQDAVDNTMWQLSKKFKKRYEKHVKVDEALRKLLPLIPKSEAGPSKPRPAPVMPPTPGASRPGETKPAPSPAPAPAPAPARPESSGPGPEMPRGDGM